MGSRKKKKLENKRDQFIGWKRKEGTKMSKWNVIENSLNEESRKDREEKRTV